MAAQSVAGQSQVHVPKGDFTWVVGSGADCDLQSGASGIEPKHAKFKREGNRCFIRDMGSKAGTFLAGARVSDRVWYEVSRYDEISLGPQPFRIHPQVFFGGGLAGLGSTELQYSIRGKKGLLCNGVYICAKPGTITAIMGPSGAGKSVFLNLLNGYNRPTSGHVLIGGQFNVHAFGGAKAVRDFVGYVPQAEVMIPELTVRQSLYYRLRLRHPDVKRDFCERFIRQVCGRLGFDEIRLAEFLNKRIGSPESRGSVLSGGERRRANIAHELVCRTQVLILDEPTSGLSSVDADQIVGLLHDLAKQDGLTIITTVHQPSRDTFSRFDDLLLMSYGGKVAYYGPTRQATATLERATGKPCGSKNPAEYVLEVLRESADRERLTQQFANSSTRPSVAPPPLLSPGPTFKVAGSVAAVGSSRKRLKSILRRPFARPVECRTLIARNARVLLSDRTHLLFALGQVPLIAALMLVAFYGVYRDNASYDTFARRFYFFGQALAAHESTGSGGFPMEANWREAQQKASAAMDLISELTARQRASVIFTLIIAAIWLGIMGTCKEVVVEHHIIRREYRSCIHLGPYVAAKMLVHAILLAVQTILLVVLVAPLMLRLPLRGAALMWLILWAAGLTAAAVGLFLSSLAKTYRVALTAVPMLIIPQLLFGGLLRPVAITQGVTPWLRWLSCATIQRWAFEGGLGVDSHDTENVLRQSVDLSATGRYAELKIIQFRKGTLVDSFFGEPKVSHVMVPLIVLACATILMLMLCHVVLHRRVFL